VPCSGLAPIEDKRFVEKGVQNTFAAMHRRVAAYPVDTAACFGFGSPEGSSLEW
jgi:hypothetical protein